MTRAALLLLSHGRMAEATKESAEEILGRLDDVFALGLSRDESLPAFQKAIEETIRANGPDRDWLVLVDLFGGSCANLALRVERPGGGPPFPILAGFNLAMVIEFALNRELLSFPELVGKVAHAGRAAILDVRARLRKT